MPYLDRRQPASFRGVPFIVTGHESLTGRRGQQHRYPQRNKPWFEDLGRRPEEFALEAVTTGPDYDQKRDALIDACREEAGPGTLIHPFLGSMSVVCVECRVIESSSQGSARFRLRFAEAGENAFPTDVPDTFAALSTTATQAVTGVRAVFDAIFEVAAVPQWVADQAGVLIAELVGSLRGIFSRFSRPQAQAAGFFRDLDRLLAEAVPLVAVPDQLASRITAAVEELAGLAGGPSTALDAMVELSDWGAAFEPVTGTTTSRTQQARNQAAIVGLVQRTAAVQAVREAGVLVLRSYDHAVRVRERVADVLDREILVAGDAGEDDAVSELEGLRARFVANMNARGASLARVTEFVPAVTIPALVVAYRLYADAERSAEIVERNRIRHPGFVPGGVPLEVLSA